MSDKEKKSVDIGGKVSGIIGSLKSDPKKLGLIAIIIVFLYVFVSGFKSYRAEQNVEEDYGVVGTPVVGTEDTNTGRVLANQDLLNKQDSLISRFGELPEGFIWDYDGTVLSLGDGSSPEEVMYAYLNGIRTLDFTSAQRYSKGSSVVSRYQNFFDSSLSSVQSYEDNFYRNMYTEVLLSIQPHNVVNIATFADNRQVFTIELEMIDLSNKDFWLEDQHEIYETLYMYNQDESDASKAEQYLYDYILDYYKSDEALRKTVTVNLTVEKNAGIDSGWLVTIDKDIDNYCYYTDGTVMNRYMQTMYRTEGREVIREERRSIIDAEKAEEERARQEEKDREEASRLGITYEEYIGGVY